MTMKYIYLNPTLLYTNYNWLVNIAGKVPNIVKNNITAILQNYNGNFICNYEY